ncbi:MAG: hypothetical protein CL600_00700 [Alteromonas sp.]|nr:hypothetical protein [Alteromonas sp.]
MKIFHVIDSGGLYGAEKMLIELVNASQDNVQHHIVSIGRPGETEKPLERALREQGISYEAFRMPTYSVNSARKLLEKAQSVGYQVAHSHGYKFNVFFALLRKNFKGLKFVTTVHGYIPAVFGSKLWWYQLADRWAMQGLDKLFLVSPHMRSFRTFRNSKAKTQVILNGIASSNQPQKRKRYKAENTDDLLLAIGRLSPEKGFANLIEAVALCNRSHFHVCLDIMGHGALHDTLAKKCQELECTASVKLLGYVEEPLAGFENYSAVVVNSVTEGLPITLLEAMRVGLIVISTRVGAIPYILGKDYPLYTDSNQPNDVFSAILKFLAMDEHQRNKLSQYLMGKFNSELTSNQMAKSYLTHYKELCNEVA